MKKFAAALALLAVGCAYPDSRAVQKYQYVAEQVVWHEIYGRDDAPPPVTWMFVDEVTVHSITLPGLGVWVACRAAETGVGDSCNVPISDTSYAHELYHWYCLQTTGDVDAAHEHCDWNGLERRAEDTLAKVMKKAESPCLATASTQEQVDRCMFD